MQRISGEVIVFDNNSTDGSKEFFIDRFPNVRFIWNNENFGFSKANNAALKFATGSYVLFLNPDTIIPEDCFEKCIAFIRQKNDECALGIRMVDGSGRFLKESKRAFPSPLTSLYKLSGLTALFPGSKVFAKYYLGNLSENKNHEIDVLAGAFMMMPRNMLDKVKGFDEDFFMYGEDIDLSFRIQQAGFSNYYFSESTIVHFKGESTKKGSLNYVKIFYKAMSIFVKKHYGGSKAGIHNFLIRIAISIRAMLAAASRLLKWIGLPVIDILVIICSFWAAKIFWNNYIKPGTNYSAEMLAVSISGFALIFLITSYYSGLYDNGFRQSRLNKSTLIAALVVLTIYGLLPESLRFSRGILVCGILISYLLTSILRQLLIAWKVIDEHRPTVAGQVLIAGSEEEFLKVLKIIVPDKKSEEILGRISVEKTDQKDVLGIWPPKQNILKLNTLKELICCEGNLTFKEIIEELPSVPPNVRVGFFSDGSHSIIGSHDKNVPGESRSSEIYYRLDNPLYRRAKRLFDFCAASFFLVTFIFQLIFKRHPFRFFRNCFSVLFGKLSFVGYATDGNGLPPLKPGILSTTGFPKNKNVLAETGLRQADIIYAKHYHVWRDAVLTWKNYQNLS